MKIFDITVSIIPFKICLLVIRDGRLHESDQILAINGALVDSSVSHKQAIGMLQKVKDKVNLIIARGGLQIPSPAKPQASPAPKEEDEEIFKVAQSVNDERQLPEATMAVALAANAAQDEPLIRMDEEPSTHFAVSRNLRSFFWGGRYLWMC